MQHGQGRSLKLVVLALLPAFAIPLLAQAPTSVQQPVESEHIAGPNGLEGWKLNSRIPNGVNQDNYPFTLVIARNGRVLRKIKGNPFVWNWGFWNDGRQIVYESGPLHFGLECNLYDLRSGRTLKTIDCFHGIPKNAPEWLVELEGSR